MYYVDYAIWGGYIFNGNSMGADFSGRQFGINAHLHDSDGNFPIRLGAYYQFTKLKSDSGDVLRKNSAGLDVNLIWKTNFICPYARGTWAFWIK